MLSDSKLGFGMMRLAKDETGKIDLNQAIEQVDRFLESGFTYFDTAYAYEGSEEAIRQALVLRHPRESYSLADKLPAWSLEQPEDMERVFHTSLERLGVDTIDFYLLHAISGENIDKYEALNAFEFIRQKKAEGKIYHIGFSFHGDARLLDKILTEHPEVEFVQLQLNYLDWENGVVQSRENYEVVRRHGLPIVVMEPVKGGTLAKLMPESEAVYEILRPGSTPSSWAFRFLLEQPGIMTILSGMNSMDQLNDNIETFTTFEGLPEVEKAAIDQVTRQILSADTIPCTKCGYCEPGCPMNIEIPELFTAFNTQKLYGKSSSNKSYYNAHSKEPHNPASACLHCGQCESVCPQHLPIVENLEKAAAEFEQ